MYNRLGYSIFFFFQAEDGIRDLYVTGVQTCALPISPLGTEIRDAHSVNGTFVNGVRVGSALLTEGDVVTIGNVDLVFTRDTLVRRTEAATRTGGLEVNSVCFEVEHGKQLLDHISLTARPGTLTAII